MAQAANNADEYASARLNMFFPGVIPELDGQCVSLVKWFMAEMSEVPNPQAARGDARYVGKTLVNQGHATEVPFDQRRRGDIVTYEYGVYGHIGIILSGNNTFEENVNWPGVPSKIVAGSRVYASRLGSMAEAWRHDMHIYRLKTYNEKGADTTMKPTEKEIYDAFAKFTPEGKPANPDEVRFYLANDKRVLYENLLYHAVIPKKGEVEKAFKDFQPWTPINTPPYTDQTQYYTSRSARHLYLDLATGLKKKLDAATTPPATPVNKEIVVDYIGKNLK